MSPADLRKLAGAIEQGGNLPGVGRLLKDLVATPDAKAAAALGFNQGLDAVDPALRQRLLDGDWTLPTFPAPRFELVPDELTDHQVDMLLARLREDVDRASVSVIGEGCIAEGPIPAEDPYAREAAIYRARPTLPEDCPTCGGPLQLSRDEQYMQCWRDDRCGDNLRISDYPVAP